jgi:phage tail-like protein
VRGLVVLGRPVSENLDLWSWHESAVIGHPKSRKTLKLLGLDTMGRILMRYQLANAWPAKVEIGALKAGASEILLESVTIVCEQIQRVAP